MDDRLQGALGETWRRSFEAQERRLAAQERAIVALLTGSLDEALRAAAAGDAHKLAGSLGSFGLQQASRLAADLENAWGAGDAAMDATGLAMIVRSLHDELQHYRPAADDVHTTSVREESVDVLLVDDDEIFAEFVLRALRGAARTVAWVADGDAARAALRNPDAALRARLILLDVQMPGLDGFTLLEELTREPGETAPTVMMLTRCSRAEDVVRARTLGAHDFLAKPVTATTLLSRVGRVLEPAA
jgi:CheY-like chemotaxis protein